LAECSYSILLYVNAKWTDGRLLNKLKETGCSPVFIRSESGEAPPIWTPGKTALKLDLKISKFCI
jgi:hypothetical protein